MKFNPYEPIPTNKNGREDTQNSSSIVNTELSSNDNNKSNQNIINRVY